MGHRHFPGSSQFFDDEHDRGWNHIHPEHSYPTQERSGTTENRLHVYPTENMSNEGMPVSSHWNSSTRPNTYTPSGHGMERPHYNPETSGPSHNPFAGSTFSAPHSHENHMTFASSSNCNNSQTWSNTMENDVRGAQKRKSPCAPSIYEMGSSSRYHGDKTSSSDHDPHYMPWLMNPTYRGESSSRNVRSRPHENVDHHVSYQYQANGFNAETNHFLPVNSSFVDTTSYNHGPIGFPASRSRFSSHRSTPTYRSSSSSNSLQLGHASSSSSGHNRSHFGTETYPSRHHLRTSSPHISWRNGSGDRTWRRRSSYERFQPPFNEASEGYMVVDHHHGDMQLDVDNMTYEELIALGEWIGSVNTGLSNEAITSCLLEMSCHQTDDQKKCAICLEEYKEKEELVELKECGHDYHGSCIKKWLSMKNSCPICKSPASKKQ